MKIHKHLFLFQFFKFLPTHMKSVHSDEPMEKFETDPIDEVEETTISWDDLNTQQDEIIQNGMKTKFA